VAPLPPLPEAPLPSLPEAPLPPARPPLSSAVRPQRMLLAACSTVGPWAAPRHRRHRMRLLPAHTPPTRSTPPPPPSAASPPRRPRVLPTLCTLRSRRRSRSRRSRRSSHNRRRSRRSRRSRWPLLRRRPRQARRLWARGLERTSGLSPPMASTPPWVALPHRARRLQHCFQPTLSTASRPPVRRSRPWRGLPVVRVPMRRAVRGRR
jgi:hypothetical protein